jgi:hypothetical protein
MENKKIYAKEMKSFRMNIVFHLNMHTYAQYRVI